MNSVRFTRFLLRFLPVLYGCFFLSLFIGFRSICSICEGVLLLVTILLAYLQKNENKKIRFRNYFLFGCLLFYLLQILSLFYTTNRLVVLSELQIQVTMIVVPLTFYWNNYLDASFRSKVMPFYILSLASCLLFCFGIALFDYSVNHNPSVFFYHKLVHQFDQHAVHFSIFVFFGFISLLEGLRNQSFILNKYFHLFLIPYYLFFIILLSSKLVIVFTFIAVVTYVLLLIKETGSFKSKLIPSALVAVLILFGLMVTNNPVGERFKDIFRGSLTVVEKNQFNPGEYLNGVQFRLIQWKLVSEILYENNAWVFGVSSGDAQRLLDKKYMSLNLFVGNKNTVSHGFLGYNTHNEFLESFLQTGMLGLLAYLVICAGFVQMMIICGKADFWLIGSLIISYGFVESVFQTQYGLLLFTFLPLFLFYTTDKTVRRQPVIKGI
jgi:O-antigen ligase